MDWGEYKLIQFIIVCSGVFLFFWFQLRSINRTIDARKAKEALEAAQADASDGDVLAEPSSTSASAASERAGAP